jgi:hypothetical protein
MIQGMGLDTVHLGIVGSNVAHPPTMEHNRIVNINFKWVLYRDIIINTTLKGYIEGNMIISEKVEKKISLNLIY